MRVAVLFDDVGSRPGATPDEAGVLEAVDAVVQALEVLHHQPVTVPAGAELEVWARRLRETAPDAVFNLCEGLGGRSEGEVLAARALEELKLPMTGSPSAVLDLARRKDQVNGLLESRGLPVPTWKVWDGFSRVRWAANWDLFPAIVKPAAEDGSVGISQASVVQDRRSLEDQLLALAPMAPLMVQAFVGTREINAAIVGGAVLPLSEIRFGRLPKGHHPIVDYAAKWSPGSVEDLGTSPLCPAPVPGSLASRIRLMALRAWAAIGGRGYGRVDFRLTPPDTLHILEVNPNPDLAPSAGLARAALMQGWDFPALVGRILAEATARWEVAV